MTVTARIAGVQGGTSPYEWSIEYDDATRRVTAAGTGPGAVTVAVQIATGGQTQRVEFLQPGTPARPGTDFPVLMGAAPAAIGPTVNANQVARVVGKIGSLGGLPFQEV